MSENRYPPKISKVIRFCAGFIAMSGLVGTTGAIVAMINNQEDRSEIGWVLAIVLFGIYIFGYIAIKGTPPKLLSWANKRF
jgi:hypothetical protein